MPSPPDPLSTLRDSLAEIDRALLEHLRRRMELAAEIGRIKTETDRPIVVRDVEDRVLTRARQHAEACGVSEEVMESVFQAIIRGSVERQYRVGISLRQQKHGDKMLIVGGAGGMGAWFRGFLGLLGHGTDVVDPSFATCRGRRGVSAVWSRSRTWTTTRPSSSRCRSGGPPRWWPRWWPAGRGRR